jgi:polyhydroxyalkanoate synthase
MLAPVEYHLGRYLRLYDNLDDREYVEHCARRLRWGFEGIDVPGALFEQFLIDLYRDDKLVKNELVVGGKPVDISNIDMPVLAVVGTHDRFIPREASLPFLDAIPSEDIAVIEFPAGHVDLSIGERAHEELWPQVCDWFEERTADRD